MNRSVIVAFIAIIALGGGIYLYYNSQKGANESQQTGGHGGTTTTTGGHQPVAQGQRSYEPEVTSDTTNVKPNRPIKFSYKIKNDIGEVFKDFEVAHEKIMHFLLVRKDLQNFQHLHPDFNQATGEFTVDITFPTEGPYRLFPDFTPGVDNPQKLPVTVYHDIDVEDMSKYKAQAATPDTQPKKSFGEYQVAYALPINLTKQQEVTYVLTIERNGKAVTDLQQYLGAMGHSVILKEGTLDFIHTHAGEIGTSGMEHGSMGTNSATGPNINFTTTFPESGVYKIFTQFQHQGKVNTVDYTIKVN